MACMVSRSRYLVREAFAERCRQEEQMDLEMKRMEREALATIARKEQKKEQERQRKLVVHTSASNPLCACRTGTWLLAHEVLGG